MGAVVDVVTFFVDGDPIPQGSKTAYVVNGRAVITDANAKRLKPWRKAIAAAAKAAYAGPSLVGAVVVHVEFSFVAGKTVRREFPSVKPDLDKLLRAVLDGLGDAGCVWGDDAQVVTLRGQKVYADRAGASVRVGVIEGTK